MKRCLACGSGFAGDGWECPHCHATPSLSEGFVAFAPALARDAEGFDESYFGELAELEARNFWFQARNRLIIWALSQYFPDAKSFLEIGCGTGFVLCGLAEAFPKLRLSGSEIYTKGLSYAAERVGRAELFQADARQLPFTAEFDVIGAFDVLEHIEDDSTVLKEMHRALAVGGGIVLTVPQHRFLWSRQDDYSCHVRRYEATELVAKIRAAGFSPVRSTSFVSLLVPVMILSRWRKQGHDARFDPLDELRIGGVINAAFGGIMGLERALITLGVDLPFGGSLLLVARRN